MLRRFLNLFPSERRLLFEAALLVTSVRIALWLVPYATLRDVLRCRNRHSQRVHPVSQVIWAVTAVSRYIPGASCLTQAFAAEKLLRANGHTASVHIGVAKKDARTLEAHAWVESGGRVVLGGSIDNFTPLNTAIK